VSSYLDDDKERLINYHDDGNKSNDGWLVVAVVVFVYKSIEPGIGIGRCI
jgi:hypothetical protein